MSAALVRVVIADDELLIREGIQRVLERASGVAVVGTVSDLPTLRAAVDELRPDVVITDIRLPPTFADEGVRFAAELRLNNPEIGVIVLSQHADPGYATLLFEHGATRRAYMLKQRIADRAKLADAVQTVARGGSHVDVQVVERLLAAAEKRRNPDLNFLTPRERQILTLMAEGKSNSAIARELVVTRRAIERHINSIFTKMHLGDSPDFSRRVMAVLSYLADVHGADVGGG
jgi:DNA-binding NarL/FixJ family response regulator